MQAFAFSAYGSGTLGNPYQISTCSQLHEIGSNLAAYYVMVRNIDCTGGTFTHLGTFTGTLDGQNHTISNLTLDSDGIFSLVDSGTVKNIKIASGSVTASGYLGSFAGRADNATFSNIHSAMTVTVSSSAYGGGLIGSLSGTTSLTKSSFSGSFSGDAYNGGLVGAMWDTGVSITDSFVSGSVTATDVYVGAAIGAMFDGSANRIYSSAALDAGGNAYTGGLIGDNQSTLSNSFAATTITNGTGLTRGLVGLPVSGTYTNNYYDTYLAGTSNCGAGSGCTAVNASNATPNYFKNNTTNGPFSTWDFTNTWATTSGYPTLRVLANFADAAGTPNSGDANGDGTQDSYQPAVASVANNSNTWVTVELAAGSGCTVQNLQPYDAASVKTDSGYSPQLTTMAAFDLYCDTTGATAMVTVIYDKLYDTSGSSLRFYNPTTNTYSTVSGATFGTRTVGGLQKTTATYSLTDGGAYDTDGSANGIIHDPVGFATVASNTTAASTTAAGTPNTGVEYQNASLPLVLIGVGSVVCIGALYGKRKYQ